MAREAGRLLTGFGHLLVAILTVDVLGSSNLVRGLESHDLPAAQFAALAALTAVLAVEVVLVVRRRPWGVARCPAVAVVLAASALAYLALPDGKTATTVRCSPGGGVRPPARGRCPVNPGERRAALPSGRRAPPARGSPPTRPPAPRR